MVATIQEMEDGRVDSDGVSDKRTSVRYLVEDAASEIEALAALKTLSPGWVRNLPRLERRLTKRVNDTTWLAAVEYGQLSPVDAAIEDPVVDHSYTFDTTGGSKHITQSLGTVGAYGPSASAELGGAIGYDGHNVNGCDITVPVYQFSEVHGFAAEDVNQAYKIAVMNMTGRVNSATFRGFEAGEVLFLGASGNRHGTLDTDPWQLTFNFAAAKNAAGLSVGAITDIAKQGWQYLWVQYGDSVDLTAKTLVKKPIAAYVEKVYEEADFSALGLS